MFSLAFVAQASPALAVVTRGEGEGVGMPPGQADRGGRRIIRRRKPAEQSRL